MTRKNKAKRRAYTKALRALARFLDKNEHIPIPYVSGWTSFTEDNVPQGMTPKQTMRYVATALVKEFGKIDKDMSGDTVRLNATWGYGVNMTFLVEKKETCTATVVGKKTVPIYEHLPAKVVGHKEVDVLKWDCNSLLG